MPYSLFKVGANVSQAKAELASLAATNKAMTASMQMAWSGVNKMFLAGAAGIAAMGGAFAAAYLANKDFNKSMVHTAALADLTSAQMNQLSDQVLGLGIRYGESSNIIADGLVILAKAGLTQQEIMTAMPTVVQLMKANAVDFEMAANIAMMTMNAFSMEYDQLAEVGDKAQKTFQATLMDIEDLQQGLQYAASTAAMAGIPFESLLAIMGTLADNAMVAGIASRSMNMMLLDIVTNTDAVQRWANSMGLGVEIIKDGKINIDEIIPAFATLGMSLDTLIKSSDIFNVRALRSWGILIGHADEYNALLSQINDSSGELARTVDIQVTSLSSMMTTMKEIFLEPFKTEEFGEKMTEVMERLLVTVTDLAPQLAGLVYNLVVGFEKALPGLVAMIEGFVKTFQTILPLIMWFGKALAGIHPWVLKLYVGFMLLKRLKIFDVFMSLTFGLHSSSIAAQQLTHQQTALMGQIFTTTNEIKRQGYILKWQALEAQKTAAAHKALAGAVMGVGFGIFMMGTGMSRQAKIMGALIVTIMAVTTAYQMMAAAAAAANPWSTPKRLAAWGSVAALSIGSLAYAGYSNIPEPEEPDFNFEMPTMPTGGYQRGARYIPETGMALVHKGEQISSANKEAGGGGGTIIEIHNSNFFSWDEFIARAREEMGILDIKEIRRHI